MRVLGIADNHDAGAALLDGDQIIAAVGQERMDRHKGSGTFPHEAITETLKLAHVAPSDLDLIAIGTTFTPAAALRWLRGWHHALKNSSSQFSYLLHLYIVYQVALQKAGLTGIERVASLPLIKRELKRHGFDAPIQFVDHHTSHAATAYCASGFDEGLILTLDAMGDGISVTVHKAKGGEMSLLYRQSGFSSINTLYSRTTEYLGFTPLRHEGKLTGLAAYGNPPPELLKHFEGLQCFKGPGFSRENYFRPASKDDAFWAFLGQYSREDVAAALQQNLEKQVCRFVRYWLRESGLTKLAVAGGVFANVKLNQRICEVEDVEQLFVYPNMSDGGLAAGGALIAGKASPKAISNVYLGSTIGLQDSKTALENAGLSYTIPANLEKQAAALLAQGKVVARASGAMEWGPRALGNRSILYRPDDPSVNQWLNKYLQRTEFMPFAPSSIWEAAEERFVGLDKAKHAAKFMTVCFDVTPKMAKNCPGVVHIDNTARPQLVHKDDNPKFHKILEHFGELTGEPTLINTSFNMHEEPIVATAEDAVRAYEAAQLDALIVGPCLTVRETPVKRDV